MKAARTDANQSEIVAGLRAIGATVQPLHAVGKGCPDLMVAIAAGLTQSRSRTAASLPVTGD